MDLISDILLICGALGVAFYCFVLSRRLTRFTDLEKGMGGAIAVLSAQVDDLTRTLEHARTAADSSGAELEALTDRAEDVARRLEMQVAALHDIPVETAPPVSARSPEAEPEARQSQPPEAVGATPPVQSFFASHRRPEAAQ